MHIGAAFIPCPYMGHEHCAEQLKVPAGKYADRRGFRSRLLSDCSECRNAVLSLLPVYIQHPCEDHLIENYSFPAEIKIVKGTEVIWKTAMELSIQLLQPDGSFDSGTLGLMLNLKAI
jgi:hypothetical protein